MTDEQRKNEPADMPEQTRSADNDGGPVSDYIGGDSGTNRDAATTTTKPAQGAESTDEEVPGE